MMRSDDVIPNNSSIHEGRDRKPATATPDREGLTRQVTSQPRLSRPPTKYRGLRHALIIFLLIMLVIAMVHFSSIVSANNDQLLLRLGNQGTTTVDLRQSFPISPYLLGANAFPETGTSSTNQKDNGFMSYSSPIITGLRNAHINLLRFPGGNWGEDHLLSYGQLNDFSKLLSQVGAEGMIQARLSGPGISVVSIYQQCKTGPCWRATGWTI